MNELHPGRIRWIILHTTAGREDATVDDIRAAHKARGFADVGYHFLVWRDGTTAAGRPVHRVGAHAKGWNSRSLGIAMVGHHDHDEPTTEQWRAAVDLVGALAFTYVVPADHVIGHRETYDRDGVPRRKTCPGALVDMDRFRTDVAAFLDGAA